MTQAGPRHEDLVTLVFCLSFLVGKLAGFADVLLGAAATRDPILRPSFFDPVAPFVESNDPAFASAFLKLQRERKKRKAKKRKAGDGLGQGWVACETQISAMQTPLVAF